MAYCENVIGTVLRWGKARVLSVAGAMVVGIAVADWAAGTRFSLGPLYMLPMVLAATVLAPWQLPILALLCALLRLWFDLPKPPPVELSLRFVFAFLAYTGASLFVAALIRNRELEEQLKNLVESSPAAVLTTDDSGVVLAANRAANALFLVPQKQTLAGKNIRDYVPLLCDALTLAGRPEGFRTEAQCQGRRENGDIFQAHVWFSSYLTVQGARLAAIVVDSSEEMRDREEQGLRQLMIGNRIAAAAVSHEVRNFCSAISLLCGNARARQGIAREDLQRLSTLVEGLEHIASWDLQSKVQDSLEQVSLQEVLDDLRIVIEPDWQEIGGGIRWNFPSRLPIVLADRHGLLQAFLNLAKNSHRAVQDSEVRQLVIGVSAQSRTASISFEDTGPGVLDPGRLFAPFQPGANGAGLGLYVSRALVRSYGGDLRFDRTTSGARFRIEVPVVQP
jgi:PAS domain S-box-containing protein